MNRKYMTSGIRVKNFIEVDPVVAPTILIYQSDEQYDIIARYFPLNHFKVIYATKDDVEEKILALNYDLAILDYFTGPGDLSLLALIKTYKPDLPVIILTDYDPGTSELDAYKSGADLFLLRPYNIEVLVYQIKALAKRCMHVIRELPHNDYTIAGCFLDIDNACLIRLDTDYYIPLAPVEVEIMKLVFAYYKEGALPKKVVLNTIYGADNFHNKKNLDVRINLLRKKLEPTPIRIITKYTPPYNGYQLTTK